MAKTEPEKKEKSSSNKMLSKEQKEKFEEKLLSFNRELSKVTKQIKQSNETSSNINKELSRIKNKWQSKMDGRGYALVGNLLEAEPSASSGRHSPPSRASSRSSNITPRTQDELADEISKVFGTPPDLQKQGGLKGAFTQLFGIKNKSDTTKEALISPDKNDYTKESRKSEEYKENTGSPNNRNDKSSINDKQRKKSSSDNTKELIKFSSDNTTELEKVIDVNKEQKESNSDDKDEPKKSYSDDPREENKYIDVKRERAKSFNDAVTRDQKDQKTKNQQEISSTECKEQKISSDECVELKDSSTKCKGNNRHVEESKVKNLSNEESIKEKEVLSSDIEENLFVEYLESSPESKERQAKPLPKVNLQSVTTEKNLEPLPSPISPTVKSQKPLKSYESERRKSTSVCEELKEDSELAEGHAAEIASGSTVTPTKRETEEYMLVEVQSPKQINPIDERQPYDPLLKIQLYPINPGTDSKEAEEKFEMKIYDCKSESNLPIYTEILKENELSPRLKSNKSSSDSNLHSKLKELSPQSKFLSRDFLLKGIISNRTDDKIDSDPFKYDFANFCVGSAPEGSTTESNAAKNDSDSSNAIRSKSVKGNITGELPNTEEHVKIDTEKIEMEKTSPITGFPYSPRLPYLEQKIADPDRAVLANVHSKNEKCELEKIEDADKLGLAMEESGLNKNKDGQSKGIKDKQSVEGIKSPVSSEKVQLPEVVVGSPGRNKLMTVIKGITSKIRKRSSTELISPIKKESQSMAEGSPPVKKMKSSISSNPTSPVSSIDCEAAPSDQVIESASPLLKESKPLAKKSEVDEMNTEILSKPLYLIDLETETIAQYADVLKFDYTNLSQEETVSKFTETLSAFAEILKDNLRMMNENEATLKLALRSLQDLQ